METIEINGRTYRVEIEADHDHGAPWDEEDGHGPVSDWTRRDKRCGEVCIAEDRGSKRFYDFAAACKIARRDGWDAKPYNTGQETKRQQAAKAATADMEYLRRWCEGRWQYVGVIVTSRCECCDDFTGASASLWGIESDAYDYLDEVALELAEELAPDASLAA